MGCEGKDSLTLLGRQTLDLSTRLPCSSRTEWAFAWLDTMRICVSFLVFSHELHMHILKGYNVDMHGHDDDNEVLLFSFDPVMHDP